MSEKAMAPHSSTLAWKIPWTEEPGRLKSMGSLRVRHNWATSLSLFTFMHWRRIWQPIPVFLPGESQGRASWWAAVYGVAQSQTRLKWLSSSIMYIYNLIGYVRFNILSHKHIISLGLYLVYYKCWFLIQNFKIQALVYDSTYLTYMQSTSWETLGWMKHKLESQDCREKYQ